MIKKYGFAILAFIFFGIGVLSWKHLSKPLPVMDSLPEEDRNTGESAKDQAALPSLSVGSQIVTPDDLQWEMDLHTNAPKFAADSGEKSGPIPVDEDTRQEFRDRVVSSVLERKIGFLYITEKLKNFDADDPSRFTKCVSMVREITNENPEFFSSRKSRERLKNKLCEQSVIEQYLDEKVFNGITISPAEIASYYRTNEKEFRKPMRVTLRQIVVPSEAEAQRLKKEAKTSNFSELARKYSMAPEAPKGGLVGPFSKEQLPSLFDIVFTMAIGEISGVIKSEFGYHIIMLVEKLPAQTQSLAEASPRIRTEFRRTKRLEAYQKWLSAAMNTIPVTATPSGI
jgi:hypothetical protein